MNFFDGSSAWQLGTVIVLLVAVLVVGAFVGALVELVGDRWHAWRVKRAQARIAAIAAEMELERRRLRKVVPPDLRHP
jgi:hypothetical protein